MIGLLESLVLIVVAVGLLGFAIFKSRRVRLAISIVMAITVLRFLLDRAFGH